VCHGRHTRKLHERVQTKNRRTLEETGKRPVDISRELGIPKGTLSRWIKQYGSHKAKEQTQVFVDYERLKKLEQANKELQEENEILKKAMHFFTKDRD